VMAIHYSEGACSVQTVKTHNISIPTLKVTYIPLCNVKRNGAEGNLFNFEGRC
jgi:hypothetical protein